MNKFILIETFLGIILFPQCTVGVLAANGYPSHNLLSSQSGTHNTSLGIYKGKATKIEKHPYLVAVTSKGSFIYAGSIIADSWVLLGARRVCNETASNLQVIAGSQDRESGTKYPVDQIVVHPNYDDLAYDYALLKIKGVFDWSKKIQKVALPSSPAKAGTEVVITGWGLQKSDSSLKEGKMKVISLETCKSIYSGYTLNFTDTMACVYNKGKTTPCDGDWTDPITAGKELHSFFIAIAHRGWCSDEAYPAICANVYPAVSWIHSVISKNSTLGFNS